MNAVITMSEKRQAMLVDELKREIGLLQARIKKFTEDITKSPAYALSWSSQAFVDATDLELYATVVAHLEGGATLQDIADQLHQDVLQGARSPSRSTSVQSNLIDQDRLSAKAKFLEKIAG